MNDTLGIGIDGHLLIKDETNDVVLCDKHNAIHPQNMSRILARALANEPNSIIGRMAFGNGGTFIDIGSNLVFNPPNIGTISGWESRLYNETYSEIINEIDADFGLDLGSSGPNVTRAGGGAVPANDPPDGGTISQEVGVKSNVIISIFLNESEPTGQDVTILTPNDDTFIFDEIGLYSPGKPAIPSAGKTSINVGDKTSEDASLLVGGSLLNLRFTVDGITYNSEIRVPMTGSGPTGEITYGDICEGLNQRGSQSWIVSGEYVYDHAHVFITDKSGGLYESITEEQSYGLFTFMSNSVGLGSSISLDNCTVNDSTEFTNVLSGKICANVNSPKIDGIDAGAANDATDPTNERERLLTHIIFEPIPKARDVSISITYTLTVSVCTTSDTQVTVL